MSEPRNLVRVCSALLAASLFAGCVTTPKREALPLQQAARHNQKGLRAEETSNLKRAGAEFAEAYRLYSSIENYPGMVTALINSSRLFRTAGELESAEAVTDRAVLLAVNTPELAPEVWFEKAKLSLLKGGVEEALLWSEKALAASPDTEQHRMLNLSARIYLGKGQRARAGELAEEGLKKSRKQSDRQEEANALRLIGELELLEKRQKGAIDRFSEALAIDKELALPRKISADLRALSQCYELMGDRVTAAAYLDRAVEVSVSHGDHKQAVVDLEKLHLLQEQIGQKDAAFKTEELIRKLRQVQK